MLRPMNGFPSNRTQICRKYLRYSLANKTSLSDDATPVNPRVETVNLILRPIIYFYSTFNPKRIINIQLNSWSHFLSDCNLQVLLEGKLMIAPKVQLNFEQHKQTNP